jgi:hypothetical protein
MRRSGGQSLDIVNVEIIEQRVYACVEPVSSEKITVGRCRRRKSARNCHSELVEVAYHFAQRSILSADALNIIHSKLSELDDVWFQSRLPCVPLQEMDNRISRRGCAAIRIAAIG